eukprot:778296-Prymnesium_polylepis.1
MRAGTTLARETRFGLRYTRPAPRGHERKRTRSRAHPQYIIDCETVLKPPCLASSRVCGARRVAALAGVGTRTMWATLGRALVILSVARCSVIEMMVCNDAGCSDCPKVQFLTIGECYPRPLRLSQGPMKFMADEPVACNSTTIEHYEFHWPYCEGKDHVPLSYLPVGVCYPAERPSGEPQRYIIQHCHGSVGTDLSRALAEEDDDDSSFDTAYAELASELEGDLEGAFPSDMGNPARNEVDGQKQEEELDPDDLDGILRDIGA